MENKSLYDPSRKTVGAIYRDAQLSYDNHPIETGDMGNELKKSLVDDINEGLMKDPNHGKPFYLMVHEKRDLQMKNALLRRIIFFDKRPWPEDDTIVFWKNPKTQELRFCWSIPHHSEMFTILANKDEFCQEMIETIKAWQNFDMAYFGFCKDNEGRWMKNPKHKDQIIEKNKKSA